MALSACSSASDATDEPAAPAASTSSSDSGGDTREAAPPETPEAKDEGVAKGETGEYASSTLNLKVKVAESKCGLEKVENAVLDDDWDGMDDAEMNKAYEARKGKELCKVTLAITNTGEKPAEPPYPAGDLTLTDGTTHARSLDDQLASDTATDSLTEDPYDGPSYDPLNPGDSREYVYVVSVPKGAKAKSLSYPNEDNVLHVTQDPIGLLLS